MEAGGGARERRGRDRRGGPPRRARAREGPRGAPRRARSRAGVRASPPLRGFPHVGLRSGTRTRPTGARGAPDGATPAPTNLTSHVRRHPAPRAWCPAPRTATTRKYGSGSDYETGQTEVMRSAARAGQGGAQRAQAARVQGGGCCGQERHVTADADRPGASRALVSHLFRRAPAQNRRRSRKAGARGPVAHA